MPYPVNMCKMWSIKKDLLKGKFMCVFREEELWHMTARGEGHGRVKEQLINEGSGKITPSIHDYLLKCKINSQLPSPG